MAQRTVGKEPSKALVIAAFASIYLIWGSTYLGILYTIKTVPIFIMGAVRFITAGSLLLGYCLLKGEKMPSLKSFGVIGFGGVLMLFVGNGAVAWVEQYLPSGLAAIIVATLPLWFVILDKRQWSYYFSNKWIIVGLLVGFTGVMLLFLGKGEINITGDRLKLISFFVLILGTISWAIGSLYSKYKEVEGSTTVKAGIQMLAAGLMALIVSLLTGEHKNFTVSQVSNESFVALLYLIIMGSLIGYMSYIWLLSVRPPSLVGTYAYVNPIVAVFLGWLIAGEPFTAQQIIALSVILAGVIIVNIAKDKKPVEKELVQTERESNSEVEVMKVSKVR